jgi:hypothetical protein
MEGMEAGVDLGAAVATKPSKNSFFDRDSGYQTLKTTFKTAKNRAVFVGFLRSGSVYKGTTNPMTVATVAAINEFGTTDGKIPSRPFMRRSIDDNVGRLQKIIQKLVLAMTEGKLNEVAALRRLGLFGVSLMREKLLTGKWVPNKPSTIARKGAGKKPLVDTSVMVNSIEFEVIDAKGKSGGTS